MRKMEIEEGWFVWRHETSALAAAIILDEGLVTPSDRRTICGTGIGERAGIGERGRDAVYLYNGFSGYGGVRDVTLEIDVGDLLLGVDEDVEGPEGVSPDDYEIVLHEFWMHRDDLTPLSDALSPEGITGFSHIIREFNSEEEWEDFVHSTDLWVRSALTGSVQTGSVIPSQIRVISGSPSRLVLVQVESDGQECETDLPSDLDELQVAWNDDKIQDLWDEAYHAALERDSEEHWGMPMVPTEDSTPLERISKAISWAVESVNFDLDFPASISVEIEEI